MPVSASPCVQYNTEKKNVEEVITAMSGIGIAQKPQYKFPVCPPAQVHSYTPRSYPIILYEILTLLQIKRLLFLKEIHQFV